MGRWTWTVIAAALAAAMVLVVIVWLFLVPLLAPGSQRPGPVQTVTPQTSPTQSGSTPTPPGPASLDETTTGVRPGTSLTVSEGITVTRAGTVIEGLHVKGEIKVEADNVTIRDTLVQTQTPMYPILVAAGVTGTVIEHVEVDNLNGTGIGIYFRGSGVVRYANIHSAEDGIRIEADDVTVENCYIHDLFRVPGGHHDSIQIRKGDNAVIRGNNLQIYVASTKDPMNAALQIGSLIGDDTISNLQVIGNLMNGGNFTVNGGGRGEVESAHFSENRFGRDFRYGVRGNTSEAVTWDASNVWDDTGLPAQ